MNQNTNDVTYYKLNNELNIAVDGKIPLHKDKEAVKAYFLEHVNPNTVFFHNLEEKIEYLVENDFIEAEFLDKYDFSFIKGLFDFVYGKKFRFRSFMSAHKFYGQYALMTNDKKRYLERFEDRIAFNALYLANGDKELAMALAEELIEQRYQPATPTFMNAGRKRRGEFISCFLVDVQDSMSSISKAINAALQLSKIGGGVALNMSNLRGAGDSIKGISNAASGVVPVMKLLEDSFGYSNQLGQRQGSGAVYLSVFHPDIIAFLSTKKENADEKIRVKTLSLGITVPDKFYELIKNDDHMYLFSPRDVEEHYGVPFSYVDITAEYDNLVDNPKITKTKIRARDLENEISKLQQESGYPYVLNVDTVNRENPAGGKIIMSNLCVEIVQPMIPSAIDEDMNYSTLGKDVSCNLGSLNIVNTMKSKDFAKTIEVSIRALTTVADESNIREVPTINNGNRMSRAVGLGAMGLHTAFALNKMEYGSPESIEFVDAYFLAVNYYTLVASNKIAIERKSAFVGFEQSTYATGEYFEKYLAADFEFKHDKNKELFADIHIPTTADWARLAASVAEHGLYHQNRQAIAPTGSISYVNEASASLQPIVQLVEERQEKKTGKTYYPAPYLSNDTIPYYKSAYDMDMRKVIDVYAAAQKHIDQSLSMTLFMRSEIPEGMYEWKNGRTNKMTTRDLNMLRNYAWKKGIKSIYYIRTFTEDSGEVGVNNCESCSI